MGYLLHYKRSGSALLLAVIAMVLLMLAAAAAMRLGGSSRVRAIRTQAEISARYAADAGASRTLYAMNQSLKTKTWSPGSLPSYTNAPLAGCGTDYASDYSAAVSGTLKTGYQITSTGRCKNASRAVRLTLALTNPFAMNFAILTQNSITLDGKSAVSGYDSSDPSVKNVPVNIGTLSDTAGAVDIKNGASVNGDVYVGMNADPQTAVLLKSRNDVNGELLNQPPPLPELVTIAAPSLPAKGKLSGKSLVLKTGDSGIYNSIDVPNASELVIDGDCVLVVTGDITLKNSASIRITASGSLTLYLAGNLAGDYAAGFINESATPSKLKLYGIGANQQIDLKNSSDFYGAIYAPQADVTLYNGGNVYGAMVVDNFTLKNSGNVYYDRALMSVSSGDQGALFMITRWEEL